MSFERALDGDGRSIIVGLSYEETLEMDALDRASPSDRAGNISWLFEGRPTTDVEKRWLQLYEKHRISLGLRRLRRTSPLARNRPASIDGSDHAAALIAFA